MTEVDALVIGEALIDRFPGADVVGGAPLNVARHLQGLGCRALLVSRVGDDAEGIQVAAAMRAAGLSRQALQRDAAHGTGVVRVEMQTGGGHRFHIAPDAAWDHIECVNLPTPRVLVFGCLAQRSPVSRAAIRRLLTASDSLRFLDLNLREGVDAELAQECLQLAHWVKLNDEELAQLLAWTGERDADALGRRFRLQRLIVTRGSAGYTCFGEAPAAGEGLLAAPFVDTVGAGDAFSACLLAAHLQGKAWAPSLQLANRFAAALCSVQGAAPADPAQFYPSWQAALLSLPDSP